MRRITALAARPGAACSPTARCRGCSRRTGRGISMRSSAAAEDGTGMPESSLVPAVVVSGLRKTYATGLIALKNIELTIHRGEIFALLGPNGAGKTTLINIICGIVTSSAGQVTVDGRDIIRHYRAVRALIGLVPQELTTDAFESVWATVSFSRGLWGKPAAPD